MTLSLSSLIEVRVLRGRGSRWHKISCERRIVDKAP